LFFVFFLTPSVRVPHCNHRRQNAVPGLGFHHHGVREHATIPADMSKSPRQLSVRAMQPVTRMVGDAQLAIWIIRKTVMSSLVVCSGPFDRGIVLSYVKINGPGPKRLG